MSESGISGPYDELLALEKRFGKISTAAIAKLGAKKIGAVARAQYRAATGPDGTPWKKNKDGSKPLANAANEVMFTAEANAIVGRAPLYYRFHQAKRPVFPPADGPLPQPWEQALIEAGLEVVEGKKR